jgi:hypothetical protein
MANQKEYRRSNLIHIFEIHYNINLPSTCRHFQMVSFPVPVTHVQTISSFLISSSECNVYICTICLLSLVSQIRKTTPNKQFDQHEFQAEILRLDAIQYNLQFHITNSALYYLQSRSRGISYMK